MDLVALVTDLDARLENRTWGSAAEFYTLAGSQVLLLWVVTHHPATDLTAAWDVGTRAPDDADALAIVTEGWRHLTIEEIETSDPSLYDKLLQEAREKVRDADIEDDPEDVMTQAWEDVMFETPVTAMPESLRKEVRNVCVVDRAGQQVYAIRDKDGGGVRVLPLISAEHIRESRVPDFMHQFLNGKRPQ